MSSSPISHRPAAPEVVRRHASAHSFGATIALIRADMQARCDYENKRLTKLQVVKFMVNSASLATIVWRLQSHLHRRGHATLASLLKTFNAVMMSVDMDSSAEIGPGLFLMHANFICIGPCVTIGRNCTLAHQNSIAPSPFHEEGRIVMGGGPTLGDDVMVGAGACIGGDITLGNRVRISMNAAVDQSFPDDAVLFGVPARMTNRPVISAEGSDA